MVEITATGQNTEKEWKETKTAWDLCGSICTNICIIGVPEGEEREKGPEKIFEEIAEKLPNVGKEIVSQVQEAGSPRQDQPEEEHSETRSSETDRNQKRR